MEATLRSEQAAPLFDKAIERFKEVRSSQAGSGHVCDVAAMMIQKFGSRHEAMLASLQEGLQSNQQT
jgi:hypothetical protein